MIEIDGTYLEGGGQILRTSIALSAITGQSCRIFNIRKGRPQPGLKHQHLESIKTVQKLCNARADGLELESTEIKFIPDKIRSGQVDVNIQTAGSIGLVLQALMVPAMHADGPVSIKFNGGATNGKWAPPVNYIKNVILPLIAKSNYKANISINRYGYYPAGGAKVVADIFPTKLQPFSIQERGKLLSIKGISHASKQLIKSSVAERQKKSAENSLKKLNVSFSIDNIYTETQSIGSAIELEAIFEKTIIASNALGERNKSAQEVGKEAALSLINQLSSSSTVDEFAEDQLLPYMALAPESSIKVFKLTDHTLTNIWTIEHFLPVKFEIDRKSMTITSKSIK